MRRTLLVSLGLTLALVAQAQAATRYVAPNATGTLCTQSAPCDQIREAYQVAVAGDTIQLVPGTYSNQGNWQNPTITGTKTVTVLGGPGVVVRQLATSGSAANVTFDGINIDGNNGQPQGALFETGGARDITFRNARVGNVHNEKGMLLGAQTSPASLNVVVDNVEFYDITFSAGVHSECIYTQSPGVTIKNSYFPRDCGATGGVLFTRGDWWGQQHYGGFKVLNNHCERIINDHGCFIFGPVSSSNSVNGAEIRGNTFEGPGVTATFSGSFTNSVESCNTPQVNVPGIAHEPCGTPPDGDGDGVPDSTDNCPAVANPGQANVDGDVLGDACDPQDNRDSDGDGVQNHADACPNEPGTLPDGCNPPDDCSDEIAQLQADLAAAQLARDQALNELAAAEDQIATLTTERDQAQALADERASKLQRIRAILDE